MLTIKLSHINVLLFNVCEYKVVMSMWFLPLQLP